MKRHYFDDVGSDDRYLNKLEEQQQRHEALFDAISDGVIKIHAGRCMGLDFFIFTLPHAGRLLPLKE